MRGSYFRAYLSSFIVSVAVALHARQSYLAAGVYLAHIILLKCRLWSAS